MSKHLPIARVTRESRDFRLYLRFHQNRSVAVQPAICSREDSQNETKRTIDVVGSNGVDTNRNMNLLILSMCQVMRIECGNGGN